MIVIDSPEMEWLAEHRRWLEREHPGQYVAIHGRSLVAYGADPLQVLEEASRKGHSGALIHRVLPQKYQGMKFVR